MAKWSEAKQEQERQTKQARLDKAKQDHIAAILSERSELFAKFRKGGWEITLLDAVDDRDDTLFLPDNHPSDFVHYWIKMPGAAAMRVRYIASVYRLAKGVDA